MTTHYVEVMQTECTVPCQNLVECIALHTDTVFLQQTACVSLITVIHIHVIHLVLVTIVHTEVNRELQAFEYTKFIFITTQCEAGTQAGYIIFY